MGINMKVTNMQDFKEKEKVSYNEAQDYMINPFMNTINSPNYLHDLNCVKVITAGTGQGKTTLTAQVFIPELIKKGVQVVIITAPFTDIINPRPFKRMALNVGYLFEDNMEDAFKTLKDLGENTKLIVVTNHAAFARSKDSKRFKKLLRKLGLSTSIWVDEGHMTLTSCNENYNDDKGYPNPPPDKYKALMYKEIEEFSDSTPHLFTLSATPSPEQTGELTPAGRLKYRVINKFAPKELTIHKTAAWKDAWLYDPKDKFMADELLEKLILDTYASPIKKGLLISCENDNGSSGQTVEHAKKTVRRVLKAHTLVLPGEQAFSVMTGEETETGLFTTNSKEFEMIDEWEIQDKMNDPVDQLKILITKCKGKVGMDICTIKNIMEYRRTNAKNTNKEPVDAARQQSLGRGARVNFGEPRDKVIEEYGYDLIEYSKNKSKKEKENLLKANSIIFVGPDNEMNRSAIKNFRKNHVSEVEQLRLKMSGE